MHAQLQKHGKSERGGGLRLNSMTRHMLGLMAGLPNAKAFRQTLSDARLLAAGDPEIVLQALARMRPVAA
jgi:tRNA-dihydrouridine synthase A